MLALRRWGVGFFGYFSAPPLGTIRPKAECPEIPPRVKLTLCVENKGIINLLCYDERMVSIKGIATGMQMTIP